MKTLACTFLSGVCAALILAASAEASAQATGATPPSTAGGTTSTTSTTTSTDATTAPATDATATAPMTPPPSSSPVTFGEPRAPSDTVVGYQTIRPNRWMLGSGLVLFGASYIPSAIIGAQADRGSDENLLIPVAGPWIALGERDCNVRACGDNEDLTKGLLVASGVAQGAGVLFALASLVTPEKVNEVRISAGPLKLAVAPASVGRSGYGLGAVGSF